MIETQDNNILQELGLLLVLVAVAILTYSSLVYFAEKEVPEGMNMIFYDGSMIL